MPDENPLRFALGDHLGLHVETVGEGRARAHLVVTDDMMNPHGALHGAVPFTMLDTAMGAATLSVLPPGQLCATIEIHLRFLRAVTEGALAADVDVIHAGARVVQLRGSVRDAEDHEVAVATGSFAVFAGR